MNNTITLCILNYYEDWLIVRAISQAYDFVDEIVIGDTSRGKDMLPEVVKGLSKVQIVPNPGFDEGSKFSWAKWRNYVQSYASSDWILWQDPDEIYPYGMLKNLRSWLEETDAEAVGFFRVAYETHQRKIVRNKETKIRLWKNIPSIRWMGDIHECPRGFSSQELWEVEYAHDINWLPSFPQRIVKLLKREERGNIIDRIKANDLDPYRNLVEGQDIDEVLRSRE